MRACRSHSEWLDLWDVHTPFASGLQSVRDRVCCVSMYLALVVGGRAASAASGGADTEGRTGRGHVNLADADGITLTTAGGARAQLYAETRCNESERPDFGVVARAGGSSGSYRVAS